MVVLRAPADGNVGVVVGGGSGHLPLRFLVGVDQRETIPRLIEYVATFAAAGRGIARVVHVVDHDRSGLELETADEARDLVDEAVFMLRMAGIGANGVVRHGRMDRIGFLLVDEASLWQADAIVLSARRATGWRRLLGRGVREQVLRRSSFSTILVPTARGRHPV